MSAELLDVDAWSVGGGASSLTFCWQPVSERLVTIRPSVRSASIRMRIRASLAFPRLHGRGWDGSGGARARIRLTYPSPGSAASGLRMGGCRRLGRQAGGGGGGGEGGSSPPYVGTRRYMV